MRGCCGTRGSVAAHAPKVGHREQARHLASSINRCIAVTIDFIGVDLASLRVLRLAVLSQGFAHFGGEIATLPRKGWVRDFGVDLAQLLQGRHGEEVRRDQEREDAGVVGGAESGMNQPAGPARVPVAVVGQRIGRKRASFAGMCTARDPSSAVARGRFVRSSADGIFPGLVETATRRPWLSSSHEPAAR